MATWQTYSTPNTGAESIHDLICVGSNAFVAIGTTGTVLYSTDGGQSWAAGTGLAANTWNGLGYNGSGLIVAVAETGANRVATSTDGGATWTMRTAASAITWTAVCWAAGANLWVAVANSGAGRVMTSPDAITWTSRTASSLVSWSGIAASSALIMASEGAVGGGVMTSTDGITWTGHTGPSATLNPQTSPVNTGSNGMQYSATLSKFIFSGFDAVTNRGMVYSSADGTSWTTQGTVTTHLGWGGIAVADLWGGFIGSLPTDTAFNPTPTIIGNSSDEGATWTAENSGFSSTQWGPAAWDATTGTIVFWDFAQTNTMLVGRFPVTLPEVTRVTPNTGPVAGGQSVTITGVGFNVATGVTFAGLPATNVIIVSNTQITATTPAHNSGAVTVAVLGVGSLVDGYAYAIGGPKLPPLPYLQPLVQDKPGLIDANWLRTLDNWKQRIENPVLGAGSVVPAESIVGVLGVAQIPELPWSRIDKTGSSLGDLTTRSATDINAGVLANAYGGAGRAFPYSYAPGSFTVPSGTFAIVLSQLQLPAGRVTLIGTGRLGVL